ncbi:hypothetical protein FHX42_002721 [Saccharopolyspora lacisalsi]|uniref:Excreted virulence factor EspC (Type VII ESX diderm) n=1 Tax=Halosaccharopolyspora lacisalsi TaxID=1000566 RepID=A0A839DWW3_9PSEU|nr:hypothetical protein [Halosaccharopolyspora lacisalsi]MBA8825370.1 hypothetical protein [Halosaccharopolyspora lacisalsi]
MSYTNTNTDAMDAHGEHLTGEITSQLDKAHTASTQTPIDSGAMGALCQLWALIFMDERDAAEEMLRNLPEAMEDQGEKVLDASRDFRERDEGAANELGRTM